MSRYRATLFHLVIAALMFVSGVAFASEADTNSANAITPGCRLFIANDPKEPFLQGYCAGLVDGLRQRGRTIEHCSPREVTLGQAVRVVVQYIDNHPTRLREPFPYLAVEALHDAWPCKP
jgi:hypothetical protein